MQDASVALINLYSKSYLSTQCKVCRKAIILQEQIISYTSISLQAGKSRRICHRLMRTIHGKSIYTARESYTLMHKNLRAALTTEQQVLLASPVNTSDMEAGGDQILEEGRTLSPGCTRAYI